VKKGTDSRSLENEDQLFTVTLEEAEKLFAQPKTRGRRSGGAAAPPLRELGEDPATGKAMVIKDGRFGPYVTDGETNASLRKADAVETISVQRAAELLADRRAAGPAAPRRRTARGTAKSSTTKSSTTKKSGTAKRGAASKNGAAKTGSGRGTAASNGAARWSKAPTGKSRSGPSQGS
jgi:DNA topoisomerase-1